MNGATAGCSRRPTRCTTSISTPRPNRRAISRSRSARTVTPSPPRSAARKSDALKNAKEGGWQIEYADQDPRIHPMFLRELARHGVRSRMGKYFNEDEITAAAD